MAATSISNLFTQSNGSHETNDELLNNIGCQAEFDIDQQFRVNFAVKNGTDGWRAEAKKFKFFEKNIYVLPVGCLTCSTKQMLFQSPIDHQNKREVVRSYSAISTYISLYCLYLLFVFAFICI